MADMIKFFKGLEANLPAAGVNGALYITTDEGAIYLGTGTGMKRLGDFVQVANVASLPEKAHENCLYYCVAENILAKWNGTEWKQINKQPTAEEMKTLLGLGSMAYKSEVAEADLSAALKEKVNAAAEGNHSHANKALLDTYTQTEADLADAVAKKHAHANAEELAKIVDGDKAKWDAVAADHLTSADKTTLENAIKEAKKAGTDANTALETYKVSNDARVLAVEEDIAEITNAENGILAQAKSYSDGKLATARTEISAEIDADVKVVNDALEAYKISNNAAVAGVKATADAAAVKTEVETALAGKVDKVEGKSLIADTEIARLANVTNYDDTQVKADIAKKADADAMATELGKKVDKVDGYSLVADTEIARLADVGNYDDAEVRGLIGDNATAISTLAGKVGEVPADKTVVQMITDAQTAATYDDEEVRGLISDNADAIAAEKERAEGIEGGLETRLKAVEDDYLKGADKTELEGKIKANADAIALLTNGVDSETVDGVNDLIKYVKDHGTEVTGIKADIAANAKAIADQATADAATFETKTDAAQKLTDAKDYADDLNTAMDKRVDALEAINHDAYIAADTALKTEVNGYTDTAINTLTNGAIKDNADAIAELAEAVYTQEEVDALVAEKVEEATSWGEF